MFPKHLHRLLVVIILQFFVPATQYAQAPEIEWTKCIGGSSWDEGLTCLQTLDSGLVVAGYRGSFDGDCISCAVYGYMFVVKLDAFGEILWQKCYGGTTAEEVNDLIIATDGGLLLAGYTSSIDGDVTGNHGGYDYWIVKTDELGNIDWQKCYGGSGSDFARSIIQTFDGGYIMLGYSSSEDGDVTEHHGELLNYDFWVVKISEIGDIEWERTLGGSEEDWGQSIIQTQDGGYLCTGFSDSDDGDLIGIHSSAEYWVVKLNNEGLLQWQKTFGGTNSDSPYSVMEDMDGNLIVSGTTLSDDGDVEGFHGGTSDSWILKLDSAGNLLWKKCFGGSYGEIFQSIDHISESFMIAGGSSTSFDGDLTTNHGSADSWIAAIDSNGVLIWQKSVGGSDVDESFSVKSTIDGGFLLVGYTASNDIDVIGNHGERDIWVVKLLEPCLHIRYYTDFDGDLYGDPTQYIYSCVDTIGYVINNLDCNDTDAAINPDAVELCNGIDDNCNTIIDEGLTIYTFYPDADGDTYGDPTALIDTCAETVTGYVSNNFDCNDSNASIYPGAEEICNYLDDDCDGVADDNLAYTWQYEDADGDLYGNAEIDTLACLDITGYITDSTDCNDLNPNIYPGAPELLNDLDDDCDGQSDEGLSIINNQVFHVSIHPIPATDHIIIDYPTSTPTTLNIYTSSGAIIYQNTHWTGEAIDISNFPPALYYLQLLQLEQVGYGCFVKE